MAPSVAEFRPDDALTQSELSAIVAPLGVVMTVTDPDRAVSIRELNANLVTAAGLRPEARLIRLQALHAGLSPKPWLGTETVARMLGLRLNHLLANDERELQLSQPATRAETAYSLARLLSLEDRERDAVVNAASELRRPRARPVAAGCARARASLRRLAVRLGGNLRAPAAAPREDAAGRLRLLGFRLARVQARAVRGRSRVSPASSRAGRRTR